MHELDLEARKRSFFPKRNLVSRLKETFLLFELRLLVLLELRLLVLNDLIRTLRLLLRTLGLLLLTLLVLLVYLDDFLFLTSQLLLGHFQKR